MSRDWVKESLNKIQADFQRSADTHLIKLDMPAFEGVDIYLLIHALLNGAKYAVGVGGCWGHGEGSNQRDPLGLQRSGE